MARREATTERVGVFSDGILAIIITIMVLELKAPHDTNVNALLELWPTFLSYGLSYLFIAVFWTNHHHLLRYTQLAHHGVIWANLFALFFVSLIPFFTAYMAVNEMMPFATALYAGNFLLVNTTFMILQKVISLQHGADTELQEMDRAANKRNWFAVGLFAIAVPAAYLHPSVSIAIIFCVAAVYFIPDAFSRR
jgi:uncharacterized membrane protein